MSVAKADGVPGRGRAARAASSALRASITNESAHSGRVQARANPARIRQVPGAESTATPRAVIHDTPDEAAGSTFTVERDVELWPQRNCSVHAASSGAP